MSEGTIARRVPGETRRLLVSSARALLTAQGLEALSTRAVAERAGIRQPTLYSHFPNRDSLLVAVADALGRELLAFTAETQAVLRKAGAADPGALKAHFEAVLTRAQREREGLLLFLRFRRTDSALGRRLTELEEETRALVVGHVRAFLDSLPGGGDAADEGAAHDELVAYADAVLELVWGAVQLLGRAGHPVDALSRRLTAQLLATSAAFFHPELLPEPLRP